MSQEIEKKIDNLEKFLRVNMVTKQEFQGLSERVDGIQESIQTLTTAVDAYAKQSKDYYQEVTVVIAKVNRIERFLTEVVAPKLGVRYDV